jgi:hypothetical protein
MRKKGSRKMANETVSIEVCSSFNFAVVFNLIYFQFRQIKQNQ